MPEQNNLNFVKYTNWKLFNKVILTKEEVYTETATEGEPFKIIVNQDYFNKEFNINGENKSNDKKP